MNVAHLGPILVLEGDRDGRKVIVVGPLSEDLAKDIFASCHD